MPETVPHRPTKQPSTVERVFVGIGHAAQEVPKIQERVILDIINKQIIPHLPKETQINAKIHKADIEKWAKRAGVGLTVAEVFSAAVIGAKLIDKLKKSKQRAPTLGSPSLSDPLPFSPLPDASPPVEPPIPLTEMITRPVRHTAHKVKEIVQLSKEKRTVQEFRTGTVPVSMDVTPLKSTKVFCSGGGATDFAESRTHHLNSTVNTQRDQGFNDEYARLFDAYLQPTPARPIIHMSHLGHIGHAIHTEEGAFARGNTNRSFWHSEIERPDSYNTVIQALERNVPIIDATLRLPDTILANTQQHADDICRILNRPHLYPWTYTGKGFDDAPDASAANRAGDRFLNSLPTIKVLFENGRSLWDPSMNDIKAASLQTLAALLDRYVFHFEHSTSTPYLFIPSPSFGVVAPKHEPYYDAIVMQEFYPLVMPLMRKARGMKSREPFTLSLPGFCTSPAIERGIRLFHPQERPAVQNYSWRHEIINPDALSGRALQFLGRLQQMNSIDPLENINFWRKQIFGDEIRD